MENKIWCLYCHTNLANGKKYIGITSVKPEERWRKGRGYYKNIVFSKAIKKYGWDGFKHEILETSLSKQEAALKEQEAIQLYKSNVQEYGYNVTFGGETGIDFNNHPELLKHLSQIRSGVPAPNRKKVICVTTLEVFDCITDAAIKYNLDIGNIVYCCKGKHHSCGIHEGVPLVWKYYNPDVNYNNIRESIINEVQNCMKGSNHPLAQKVVCITTGQTFSTFREAIKFYNLPGNSLKIACDNHKRYFGKDKDNNKLYWAYYDDYVQMSVEDIKAIKSKAFERPVICIDTRKIYKNVEEASLETGIIKRDIVRCCTGIRNTAGGYSWKYKEGETL